MKRILAVCMGLLLAAAALPMTVAAQDKPNFTGTWAASTEAPQGIAAAPSAILGARFALKHEGEMLEVTRTIREESIAVRHKLDGSRGSLKVPGRLCEGETEFLETVTWEGATIVLTGVGRVPPGGGAPVAGNVKRLLRLQDADTLVVEASITQAGSTRAVATVYKRSSDSLPLPKVDDGVKGAPATIAQIAWIPGMWVSEGGNVIVEERWTPPASGAILGLGRTLRGPLMASFEFLCVTERGGSLVYVALPDGRTTPTFFTLTNVTAESATFENPKHDYPKLVRYTLKADGSLETTISGAGGQRSQSVVLKRKE